MPRLRTVVVAAMLLVSSPFAFGQEETTPQSVHLAAFRGDLAAVRACIEAGADLDSPDAFGSSPLSIAATFGHEQIARELLNAGADPSFRTAEDSTPLHIAAFLGRERMVRDLLEHGADRAARNGFGSTAFDSVIVPFEEMRDVYDSFAQALAPLGLELDDEAIRLARPRIAEMLRPRPEELESVGYAPRPGPGWAVSTPAAQGLDASLVAELFCDASSMPKLNGLLVVKDGRLIAEDYFNGGSIDRQARVQSVTKSVLSALVGIALERGLLSSADQPIVGLFPEIQSELTDPRKRGITVRHLLQMRAGYPWEETDPALWDGILRGVYIPMIQSVPLQGDPGTEFNYSNLSSNWLGIILTRACGTDLETFAREHLFSRLGIEPGRWGRDALGHNNGCGDLYLTARSMARFGQLYLDGGRFEGEQIVPAEWVAESLEDYSPDAWVTIDRTHHAGRYFRDLGYGYQWWSATIGDHDADIAWGHGGQLIVLLHELDMVVVTQTDPFHLQHDDEAWKHEKATLNLVGKFVRSLPAAD